MEVQDHPDGVFKTAEKLWLQTSTGPNFTYPKLFLQAHRIEQRALDATPPRTRPRASSTAADARAA